MKPIVYLLICFLVVACGKEESEGDRQVAAALKVLPGAWEFNRLATDPDFQNLVELVYPERAPGSYIIFDDEGGFTNVWPFDEKEPQTSGKYILDYREPYYSSIPALHLVNLSPNVATFNLVVDCAYDLGVLYSYSKDRLVFYVNYYDGVDEFFVYSEFLRKW